MKRVLALLISILVIPTTQGQSVKYTDSTTGSSYDNRGISLLAGYNQGYYGFAELGVAANKYTTCPFPMAIACFASSEIKVNDPKTIGPKVGIWMTVFAFSAGLNFIYYTDFHKNTFVFRPEIGLGVGPAKVVYGYNARITSSLEGINRHQLGIAYCLRLRRY